MPVEKDDRMSFELCPDATAAQWLIDQNLPWYRLAGRGPLGFQKYARLNFIPDPGFAGQRTSDVEFEQNELSELGQVGVALNILAKHTTTPGECYFAMWDGWDSITVASPPNFKIPNRDYFLFQASLADYEDWSSTDPVRWPYGDSPDPAFIWPADHAWCITNDVDPHFATVAASSAAIIQIHADPHVDSVPDDPDVEPPYWA